MLVKLLRNFAHPSGVAGAIDDILNLPDEMAQALIKADAAIRHTGRAPADLKSPLPAQSKSQGAQTDKPPELSPGEQDHIAAEIEQRILAAVDQLDTDNDEHYTKSGKPMVDVVQEIVGKDVDVTRDLIESALASREAANTPPPSPADLRAKK